MPACWCGGCDRWPSSKYGLWSSNDFFAPLLLSRHRRFAGGILIGRASIRCSSESGAPAPVPTPVPASNPAPAPAPHAPSRKVILKFSVPVCVIKDLKRKKKEIVYSISYSYFILLIVYKRYSEIDKFISTKLRVT